MAHIAQVVHNEDRSMGTTLNVNINGVQAGSALLTALFYIDPTFGANISDGVNTYAFLDNTFAEDTAEHGVATLAASNVGAGNYTVTLTNNPTTYRGLIVIEVRGVTTDPIGAQHEGFGQSVPGTGTDAIVSSAVSINQNALVVGICYSDDQIINIAAGTGFTQHTYFNTSGDYLGFMVASKTHTGATGSDQATFTALNAGLGKYHTFVVGLDDGVGVEQLLGGHHFSRLRRW